MEAFQRLKVIGKGSYGEVWLAIHQADKKQYVLKKMELRNASRRERKAAEQEAKLLSKLKHPNIVAYKDSFETDNGLLWIAMGYCEGGDLYSYLKGRKGILLDERQIVEWFVQISMALQYLHERNVLHRDLKTQNIFLTRSRIIKVGDLGIARVLDSESDMATTLIGTPYYMSPELFANKPYNHKSDVWALGCCVHEMATLRHAFNAKDMNALVYKILRGRAPPMPDQYSRELAELVKAMLSQNPARRPSVAKILRDPYIRKNIAIFLEGTKNRARRPVSSSELQAQGRSTSSSSRKAVAPPIEELPVRGLPHELDTISEASQSEADVTNKSRLQQQQRANSASSKIGGQGWAKPPGEKVNERPRSTEDAKPSARPRNGLAAYPSRSNQPPDPAMASAADIRRLQQESASTASSRSSTASAKPADWRASSAESDAASDASSVSGEPIMMGTNPNLSARARRREKKNLTGELSQHSAAVSHPSAEINCSDSSRSAAASTRATDGRLLPRRKASEDDDEEVLGSAEGGTGDVEIERSERDMVKLATLLDATLNMQPDIEDEEDDAGTGESYEEATLVASNQLESAAKSGVGAAADGSAVIRRPAEPVQRTAPSFGKETLGSTTRLNERFAALHKDCIRGVGYDRLRKAYQILDEMEDEEVEGKLLILLGPEMFEAYAGKIWQLKFCEESAYRQK